MTPRYALAIFAVLAACGGGEPVARTRVAEPPPEAIAKVTENGPVKATVQVWPAKPTHGDAIHLRLTIEAAPGVVAAAPFEDEALGRFQVAGFVHDQRRRGDGGTIEIQSYTLDSPGSGKHRIPPLRVEVTDGRTAAPAPGDAGAAGPTEILTEEVPLEIAAIDPARATEPLAEARGALPEVVGGIAWWAVALAVALGGVAVVGGVRLYRAARRASERRARVSAYQDAVSRLERLLRAGAPEPSTADAWFVELSSIVRGYLEGRFGVRAPELTTEEFLQEARRAGSLSAQHRELLTAFLERCDRVKFAGYRPDADESLATLTAARAFVEDTRLREPEAA